MIDSMDYTVRVKCHSHDARFVNGVNLPVDGGLTASNGQPPMS